MKTEEDEAFEAIERRQGGFQAKRAMAADKFIAAEERKVGERYGYVPKLHPSEWMNAQPAQEPVQREWVGLTEEERNKFDHLFQMSCSSITVYDQICRVEAKLKEKNNGT